MKRKAKLTPRQRQIRNRKVICYGLAIAFFVVAAVVGGTSDYQTAKAEMEMETEISEPISETETETEIEVKVSEKQPIKGSVEPIKFFDVPLSKELQLHIFAECEKHNIAPALIIAMIERESNFQSDAIGDNGESFGLMQIQRKWHEDRMNRLGVTDLLNPFQNVTVGIDLVAELKNENPELYWVLMAYNGGRRYATEMLYNRNTPSNYALEVAERSSELQREMENK